MAITEYHLSDRFLKDDGRVFLTGVQALARLPIEQMRIDKRNGLKTAAFVSGYPGSPLGGFDMELEKALRVATDVDVVLQPAVNEELGATAVMGSQLATEQPDATYEGVLGIWYGKGPGIDRAGDALRHANFTGTSSKGGAIALVGDDPAAKSSTIPSSSDATIYDLHMPLFYPGDVQEVVDLGRHAVALSRMTGLWTSMKIVSPVADGSGTVDLGLDRVEIVTPDLSIPGDPNGTIYDPRPEGRLLTPKTLELERDFRTIRLILAQRYATANKLNHATADPNDAWIGLVATGYTYRELLEALRRLGLPTTADIEAAGIRLLHTQMPLSIDPNNIRNFARGLDEIIVVEEKNPTLEWLVKDALYGGPHQPRVVGKRHEDGRPLMPDHGILDAGAMVTGLRERLSARIADRLAPLTPPKREKQLLPLSVDRSPYFCSGCPHNRSTKVPDDTLVGAGIGCHGMVLLMDDSKVGDIAGITAMGAEGSQFIGMAPFVEREHFIQNIGDGTFFHSGQLAIQASVAAGMNTTYKLLYNGTVAMTGGQDAVGGQTVPEIATALLAHGVAEVLVTTDDVSAYRSAEMPVGPKGAMKVWDRDRVVEAQEYLATVPGVTVMIHDQACAAQARRLRKRGLVETPPYRIAINHRICEACGDCGTVSNCLSVQAIDTPLGTKTTIDQSSCNLDYSCLEGDCPSFIQITPNPKAKKKADSGVVSGDLPDPDLIVPPGSLDLRMVGIGGTGVVTVAQIVATAAMLDGLHVRGLDQTGLSQKAGRVSGDLRITTDAPAPSNLIGDEGADVIIAFDLLGAASPASLSAGDPTRTVLIGSASETPTGSMIGKPEVAYPELDDLRTQVAAATLTERNRYVDAAGITEQLLGSAASANIFLLGFAYQHGVLPIAGTAIEKAIRLNGVAVEANLTAFAAGRAEAVSADTVVAHADGPQVHVPALPGKLATRADELGADIALRAADLLAYQSAALAGRYLDLVERAAALGNASFTEAVAISHHLLLAYKDEYEVARLLTGPEATAAITAAGGAGAKASWKLHPPILKSLGMKRKITVSTRVGVPIMKVLATGKRLRGTVLDPFGRTQMRKLERELIDIFESSIDTVLARIAAGTMTIDEATDIASLPQAVRGYEDLKTERAGIYRSKLATALD